MEITFDNELIRELVATAVLVVVVVVVRAFLLRLVRAGSDVLSQEQRRWSVSIRNGSWAVLVLGLFFVWAPQLQTLALSITAFAVAVVLATREVIANLVGGLMRAGTQPFKIGDWVTIDGVAGEVVDMDATGVHLEEVDLAGHTYQYTGQSHVVPNIKLLTASISKLSFHDRFVIHDVPVAIQHALHAGLDPDALMTRFAEIADRHFAAHREEATKAFEEMRRQMHVDLQGADPQIFMRSTEHSHYVFTARLFLPTAQAARIGTEITREFVHLVYQEQKPQPLPPA